MMKSSSKEAKIESIAVIFSESWSKEKGGETGTHIRGHLAHQVCLGLRLRFKLEKGTPVVGCMPLCDIF